MKSFLTAIILVFCFPCLVLSSPLNLDLQKEYKLPPEIENFRYWYGDISYGYLIYIGTKDIAGFETELHVYFLKKTISKSLLILGPSGLDNDNCFKRYSDVVKILNKKYGHYLHRNVVKDPIFNDLISLSVCSPVRNDLYSVETYWVHKSIDIVAKLIGDEEGIYIEIEYRNKFNKNKIRKEINKLL